MQKLFNFGLKTGTWGVATEKDIQELCVALETEVNGRELASFADAEDFVCCGGVIDEDYYIVSDGIMFADDEGLELISNLKLVM